MHEMTSAGCSKVCLLLKKNRSNISRCELKVRVILFHLEDLKATANSFYKKNNWQKALCLDV